MMRRSMFFSRPTTFTFRHWSINKAAFLFITHHYSHFILSNEPISSISSSILSQFSKKNQSQQQQNQLYIKNYLNHIISLDSLTHSVYEPKTSSTSTKHTKLSIHVKSHFSQLFAFPFLHHPHLLKFIN